MGLALARMHIFAYAYIQMHLYAHMLIFALAYI